MRAMIKPQSGSDLPDEPQDEEPQEYAQPSCEKENGNHGGKWIISCQG